jgi:hypothetical protein
VVGHGLFIRLDYLQKIRGFTTDYWCEDIYLSFFLRSHDVKIYPIFAVEYGESPKNLKILMKQNATWFKTLFENGKIYSDLVKKHIDRTSAFSYLINQYRGAFAWLFLPTLYLAIIFYLFLLGNWQLGIIFLFSYIATTTIRYWLSNRIVELLSHNTMQSKLYLAFLASFAYLISNIGPLYSLLNPKRKKYKTER